MTEATQLTNHFLIAMPALADPNFHRTVAYICEHNEHGAIGIIINRPMEIQLEEVFAQVGIVSHDLHTGELPVLYGGPVQQERGFVIHRPFGTWRSTMETAKDIAITTSQDILQAMADGKGPNEVIVALGYAGWGAGQLSAELQQNAWLSCPADPKILFETPFEDRWEAAAKLLGVDINMLSGDVGHS